jgi:hypothetical protein
MIELEVDIVVYKLCPRFLYYPAVIIESFGCAVYESE